MIEETPTKPCVHCQGEDCPSCDGSGVVDMTEDDLWFEREARLEKEADFMNDK